MRTWLLVEVVGDDGWGLALAAGRGGGKVIVGREPAPVTCQGEARLAARLVAPGKEDASQILHARGPLVRAILLLRVKPNS